METPESDVLINDRQLPVNHRHISKALRLIRKTHTHESKLQRIRNSTLPTIKKKRESNAHYGPPVKCAIKSLEEIKIEAKENWQLKHECKRREQKIAHVGVPKKIFVGLISKIKEEIYASRKNSRLENHNSLSRPQSAHTATSQTHDFKNSTPVLKKNLSDSHVRSHSSPSTMQNSPRNFKDYTPTHEGYSENILRQHHSSFELQKIQAEEALISNILTKKLQNQYSRLEQEKKNSKIKQWLRALFQVKHAHALYMHCLKLRREEQIRSNPRNVLSKHAMAKVDRWLMIQRIKRTIKKYPREVYILRGLFRRFWFKILSRKLGQAVDVLVPFLQDCRVRRQYFKKIYEYRDKIRKVQRYICDWLAIQRARIELLYLAKERVDKKKQEIEKIERLKNQRKALLATEQYSGFKKTMNELKAVKHKFASLFHHEKAYMEYVNRCIITEENEKEALRKQIVEEELKYRSNLQSYPLSDARPGIKLLSLGSGHSLQTKVLPIRLPLSPKTTSFTWYERAMRNHEMRNRIESLRKVLISQRKRHIVNLQILDNDRRFKIRQADVQAIKAFLKAESKGHSNESKKVAIVFENHESSGKGFLSWKRVPPTFLLLTQGGNEALSKLEYPVAKSKN